MVQTRLSSSCNDLLRKLLARDKLTVAEIMKQPWFLVDFPKGLKEMNSYCLKMKVRSPESCRVIESTGSCLDSAL